MKLCVALLALNLSACGARSGIDNIGDFGGNASASTPSEDAGTSARAEAGVDGGRSHEASADSATGSPDAAPRDAEYSWVSQCEGTKTVLWVNGEPGSYIHPGPIYVEARYAQLIGRGSRASIEMRIGNWTISMAAPAGQDLAVGTYSNAHDIHVHDGGPVFNVGGNGRGCSGPSQFRIFAMEWDAQRTDLLVAFSQQCEPIGGRLQGCLHVVETGP